MGVGWGCEQEQPSWIGRFCILRKGRDPARQCRRATGRGTGEEEERLIDATQRKQLMMVVLVVNTADNLSASGRSRPSPSLLPYFP